MDFTWPFLGTKSNRVIGVDISSTAVKILELSRHDHQYRVENYGTAPIAPNAIIENDIKDLAAVAEAVELAWVRSNSSLKSVAASIPNSAVITKVLQMDASISELEMTDYIQMEASRYIPYPLEEVALDFTLLGLNEKENTKMDVLVVAARNEHVETRAEIIRQAGLTPKIMDVQSYAIERTCNLISDQFTNKGKNQTVAVIDIGSIFTTITILHNLHTVYTRDEMFGGRQLTEAIQRRYGLTEEQARLMKKSRTLC